MRAPTQRRSKQGKVCRLCGGRPCHYEKYSNNAAASHAHESELWLAFYILWLTSHKTRPFERLGVGRRSPPRFVPACQPERNERSQV